MLIKQLTSNLDVRRFELEGKTYTSFTPHIKGDIHSYEIYEGYCCDVESYMVYRSHVDPEHHNPKSYILNTLAQLLNNNHHIKSYEELCKIYMYWIYTWRGNEEFKNKEQVERVMEWAKPLLTTETDLTKIIVSSRIKKHWYPLEIELITDSVKRSKKKRSMRDQGRSEAIVEDLRIESNAFKNKWWGVTPTATYLGKSTDNSTSTVYKYGEGLYTSQKDSTAALITALKENYPGLSQAVFKETVKEKENLQLTLSTIKRYWNG